MAKLYRNQQNKTECSKTNSHLCKHSTFHKCAKEIWCGQSVDF